MASTVTRDTLRTRIRDRGDIRDYVDDTEMNAHINDSIAAWYDLMVEVEPHRYRTTANVVVSSGSGSLPSDFYRLLGVERSDTSYPSGYVDVPRRVFQERNDWQYLTGADEEISYDLYGTSLAIYPTSWNGTLRLQYIPTAPSLSDDVTTLDVIDLWSEWIVNDVIIKCKAKEESDFSAWHLAQQRCEQRIRAGCIQDAGKPPTVTSIFRRSRWSPYGWRRTWR